MHKRIKLLNFSIGLASMMGAVFLDQSVEAAVKAAVKEEKYRIFCREKIESRHIENPEFVDGREGINQRESVIKGIETVRKDPEGGEFRRTVGCRSRDGKVVSLFDSTRTRVIETAADGSTLEHVRFEDKVMLPEGAVVKDCENGGENSSEDSENSRKKNTEKIREKISVNDGVKNSMEERTYQIAPDGSRSLVFSTLTAPYVEEFQESERSLIGGKGRITHSKLKEPVAVSGAEGPGFSVISKKDRDCVDFRLN